MSDKPASRSERTIHDRIVACIEQAGHPDWSLREMIDALKRIAIDARRLEAPRSELQPRHIAGRQREADHTCLRRLSNMSGDEMLALGIVTPEDAFNYAADMLCKNTLVDTLPAER